MPTRRVGLQQRVYSFSSAKIHFYPRHPCSTSTKQFQTNMVWPLAQAGGMRTTCFRPAMLFVTIPTACADRAMYLMATAQTNSSCQKRFTRVTVRGSLMLTVVHFMHPTKHWLLSRVHAVHHELEILSINICRKAGFTSHESPSRINSIFGNLNVITTRKWSSLVSQAGTGPSKSPRVKAGVG